MPLKTNTVKAQPWGKTGDFLLTKEKGRVSQNTEAGQGDAHSELQRAAD